jgi:ElaB/YqjD/DUF883 family membrane-anchored ribosome-binding protein
VSCLSREKTKTAIQAVSDALTYRPIVDSLKELNDTANILIARQNDAIKQGNKTIEAKDESIGFEKTKGEMLAKENDSLVKSNGWLRIGIGGALAVALVEWIRERRATLQR